MSYNEAKNQQDMRYSNKRNENEEIPNNYQELLEITEQELLKYKNEKKKLKEEVLKILEENQATNVRINEYDTIDAITKHEQLTNDAISKLKKQINILREERDTIKNLWEVSQKTISSLENEIIKYRGELFKPSSIREFKQRYSNTILLLEKAINTARNELDKQIKKNKEILDGKSSLENKLKLTESKFSELTNELSQMKNLESNYNLLKKELENVIEFNKNINKLLKLAKNVINERFLREKLALEKVQEALLIAENAIAEKESALQREILIREECNTLANNIGQIMEEAALKVEEDVNKLKKCYEKEIEKLFEQLKEADIRLKNQKEISLRTKLKCQYLESKIKDVLEKNVSLESDIQLASQTIIQLELKLTAIQTLNDFDKKATEASNENQTDADECLFQNKDLNDKWKQVTKDVIHKYKKHLTTLEHDIANLRAENADLKLRLCQNQ